MEAVGRRRDLQRLSSLRRGWVLGILLEQEIQGAPLCYDREPMALLIPS